MNIYIVGCTKLIRNSGIVYPKYINQIITASSEEKAREAFSHFLSAERIDEIESDINCYMVGEA